MITITLKLVDQGTPCVDTYRAAHPPFPEDTILLGGQRFTVLAREQHLSPESLMKAPAGGMRNGKCSCKSIRGMRMPRKACSCDEDVFLFNPLARR